MLCKIGDVEVWRVMDYHGAFRAPEQLFPNAGPDVAEVIENLAPGSVCPKSGGLILPVQGFLLKTPTHIILVDACVGNHKTSSFEGWHLMESDRFEAGLTAAGVTPEDVDYVLCTHLHGDHVGWNTRLENGRWVPTFPNARYLFPAGDVAHFGSEPGPSYNESVLPVIEAGQVEEVEGRHNLGEHVTLIPTPGHTPGHVSVQISCGGAEGVITGDAIHTSAQCAHPDWHFVFDTDAAQAVISRRYLLEHAAMSRAQVLGTHFSLPSIGRIEENGGVFRWIAN